jgi:hypothetical protein
MSAVASEPETFKVLATQTSGTLNLEGFLVIEVRVFRTKTRTSIIIYLNVYI